MVESGLIQMGNECTKFCVSTFTTRVVEVGVKRLIQSWNNRPASGRRNTPIIMMNRSNRTAHIREDQVPDGPTAAQIYESNGGHLTRFGGFGRDPLLGNATLLQQRELIQNIPSYEAVFNEVVNGNTSLFQHGLMAFISFSSSHTL
ncbi:hypothetical protein QZH41_017516 [Actinostola sp. cb2023]|nr:hypothetical protein QZH41_017516 [Actinostola sp. cb2023]